LRDGLITNDGAEDHSDERQEVNGHRAARKITGSEPFRTWSGDAMLPAKP
jgi:hypothetical protein